MIPSRLVLLKSSLKTRKKHDPDFTTYDLNNITSSSLISAFSKLDPADQAVISKLQKNLNKSHKLGHLGSLELISVIGSILSDNF